MTWLIAFAVLLIYQPSYSTILPSFNNDNPSGNLLPEDIPDSMYQNLMSELPFLREHLMKLRNRQGNDELLNKSLSFVGTDPRSMEQARRQYGVLVNWQWSGTVATCYYCGFDQDGIPNNSLCHDAFESDDWRARTLSRFMRTLCVETGYLDLLAYEFDQRKRPLTVPLEIARNEMYFPSSYYHYWYTNWNQGSKTQLKSYFWKKDPGGCFKRYLDVGTIYTQRGCRRQWPIPKIPSYATHRYVRLELMMHNKNEGCVTSPAASLTPFARSISLWARYHVCVCTGKYCNGGTLIKPQLLIYLSLFIWRCSSL